MITPYPYQIEGANFIACRERSALWDEPGLGKSMQALLAAKANKVRDAVIVCPASVRLVWRKECSQLDIDSRIVLNKKHLGSGINILSYEGAIKCYDDLMRMKKDLVVYDEAHYLKTPNTKRTTVLLGTKCDMKDSIGHNATFSWGLTGTPMPNNPSELWSFLHAFFPDALEKPNGTVLTYWEFMYRYCSVVRRTIHVKTKRGAVEREIEKIVGSKNMSDLRDRIRGRILRRKKKDVLKDLPPIRYQTLPLEGKLKNLDEKDCEVIKKCLDKPNPIEHLKSIDAHFSTVRKIIGMSKVDAVKQWVKESPYDKIVLFAHHKTVIDGLRDIKDCVHIDGSCTQRQREQAVEAFQHGNARVFIGQIQAAGTGLTLTAANVLVFVECSWVPAENKQAADRIHRIGQKDSCLVYIASITGSIDERIMEAIKIKLKSYKELGL